MKGRRDKGVKKLKTSERIKRSHLCSRRSCSFNGEAVYCSLNLHLCHPSHLKHFLNFTYNTVNITVYAFLTKPPPSSKQLITSLFSLSQFLFIKFDKKLIDLIA